MLRAIVFDFDGVIADSEPLHYRAFKQVLAEEGVDLIEHDYYSRYLGYNDVRAFAEIAADHGRPLTDDVVAALVARKARLLEQLERQGSILFPGAEALVRHAAELMPLAIASGALRAEIVRVLESTDLARCFSAIVAAEDVSASKPAPDPYVRAVALLAETAYQLNNPPIRASDCLAIEDSRWGIESARAAGLRTIGVTHSYEASDLSGADVVVASLTGLDVTNLRNLWSQ